MPDEVVIGVDCSTTACKAVAWDREGRMVAEGRATFEELEPHPGWHEQDALDWRRALREALTDLTSGLDATPVGLAITHQRESFVPLDADDQPLRNGILWNDGRCRAQLDELAERFGAANVHETTGRPLSMTQSLPKVLWVHEHEPEALEQATRVVEVHAYLVADLTGEWITSSGSADSMGMYDMAADEWDTELVEGAGLRTDQLVETRPPGARLGEVREDVAAELGLPAGLPVFAGIGDGQAAALGAGAHSEGLSYFNLGTAVTGGPLSDAYVTTPSCRTIYGGIPGTFVMEHVLRGGVATVAWFMSQFEDGGSDETFERYEAQMADLPPGSEGLVVVPYWNTVMNPHWDPEASGVTLGWRSHHTKAHFLRAIEEGILFEHRLAMDGIVEATGEPIEAHIILGGGSSSDQWCQMAADVLDTEIRRASTVEATCLGAGILAAAGAGWHDDVRSAAEAMTSTTDSFTPDADRAQRYDRLYREVFTRIYPGVKEASSALAAFTDDTPGGDTSGAAE